MSIADDWKIQEYEKYKNSKLRDWIRAEDERKRLAEAAGHVVEHQTMLIALGEGPIQGLGPSPVKWCSKCGQRSAAVPV
jgi:hypothetical protein